MNEHEPSSPAEILPAPTAAAAAAATAATAEVTEAPTGAEDASRTAGSAAEPPQRTIAPRLFRRLPSASKLLRRGIPILLSAVTAAVMGFSALNAVLSAGLSEERITKFLLSDLTGGAAAVSPMPTADPAPLLPTPETMREPTPDRTSIAAADEPDGPDTAISANSPDEPDGSDKPDKPEQRTEPPDRTDLPAQPKLPDQPEPPELLLSNETGYTPDLPSILSRPRAAEPLETLRNRYGNDAPVVLILHTHATEAYADSPDCRSEDPDASVTALGSLLTKLLEEAGIPALHDETPFDLPDFTMAYYNASRAIRSYIADCPSIRYILDLHRDSVKDEDGNELPLTCETEEGSAARLMFVVGTDFGGADHPGWQDNLALALRLQISLSEKGNGALMRNPNLRSASFNEQYSSGSLLIEVGSGGNTMEEAKRSVTLFAEAFIREVKGE